MAELQMTNIKPIQKLDETVVNRIAAGEVIQRPANALKELIENSLDAKSTNIQIIVKEGGLKLLQIQDNGCGIRAEDMTIVCERFTTSKLQKFEDLQSIATYGFRGEALASISHVAHVTIKTKTADSKCAFQASYVDGKPKGPCKPCAGNQGTIITVEDLFFNVPIRRKAFNNYSAEYGRIADVVTRYAIHNASVSFSLKRDGNTVSSIKTLADSSAIDNIKMLFGADVAREMLEVGHENQTLNYKMKGHITSSNYSANKTTFILFINHRLVESSSLRKAIEAVYTAYLPKHKSPFIYISIEIASQNIDINVHPTKQEVHFLHETSITEDIQKAIETRLLNINQSRTMYLQTLLPSAPTPSKPVLDAEKSDSNNKSVQPYQMVRTDSRDQKLDAFLRPNVGSQEANKKLPVPEAGANTDTQRKPATVSQPDNLTMTNMPLRQEIRLKSVLSLRKGIEDDCDSALKQIFSDYSFVGCVTRAHSLIQHQTKLLLVNTNKLSQQLFYQIILRDFGNFKALKLSEPASIRELAMMALDSDDGGWIESYGPKDKLVDFIVDLLKSKADMLLDYFALEIDSNGMLVSLPYLLENYFPSFMELPIYILRLSTDVDWDNESECFKSFALVTSHFYAFPKYDDETQATEHDETATEQNHGLETNTPNASGRGTESWKWVTEHIIYTTFRKIFRPPQEDATNGTVLQIANLVDLYKVFERC